MPNSRHGSGQYSGQLIYTVTGVPFHGTLQSNGANVSSFSQADIDAGRISYVNNGDAATSDAVLLSLSDGASLVSGVLFTIDVNTIPLVGLNPIDQSAFAGEVTEFTADATQHEPDRSVAGEHRRWRELQRYCR